MNNKRFETIGLKQSVRLEWMDRCVGLLLSGMSAGEIRKDLTQYLADKKESGGIAERGAKTYTIALGILAAWFDPAKYLLPFRDSLLKKAKELPSELWMPLHWAIMSAASPFWHNVAIHTGRVSALQERITQKQIFDRIVEHYGQRTTVLRSARRALRTFVYWGLLKDTEIRGRYARGEPFPISDPGTISLLFQAILISTPGHKANLRSLANSPALFPFCIALELVNRAIDSNPDLISERLGDGEIILSLEKSPKKHRK